MSKGNYGVYHFDTHTRQAGQAILEDVDINTADKEAKEHARVTAARHKASYSVNPKGSSCIFDINGRRMGFIVKKSNSKDAKSRVSTKSNNYDQ